MTTTSTPSPEALPAMQEGEYPPMPEAYDGAPHHEGLGIVDVYDADQMRAYVDADRASRAQAAPAAASGAVAIKDVVEWIRNNYQDHNIASLGDALIKRFGDAA